jgi:hypothetical protein
MLFKCKIQFKNRADNSRVFSISFAMRAGSFDAMSNKCLAIAQLPVFWDEWEPIKWGGNTSFERDDLLYSHICTYGKSGGLKGEYITSPVYRIGG